MDTDGGPASILARCPRDDVDTRLQCSECGTPICPACFVRTAVGLRCENCGAGKPVLSVGVGGRRTQILAAVAVMVALVAAGAWAATRGGGGSSDDVGVGGERVAIPTVQLGNGELPGGMTWALEARRDGSVCVTLTTSPGPPPRERCQRTQSSRAIHNTTTRAVRGPSGTVYLTLVQVSDRTERVHIAPDGAEPREIPTLGGDTGLGVRFFVTYTTENVDESYIALAGDGTVLGQFNRPKMSSP
jgi:hypothetical protein